MPTLIVIIKSSYKVKIFKSKTKIYRQDTKVAKKNIIKPGVLGDLVVKNVLHY